jgi:hypothetical protein
LKSYSQVYNKPRKKLLIDAVISIIFIITIFLDTESIMLYRFTITPWMYIFNVGCIGAVIGFSILLFIPDELYSKVLCYILVILTGGSLLIYGFLQINSTFSDQKIKVQEFPIIKSGTISSNRSPCIKHYTEIDFNGLTKKLLFDCDYQNTIKTFSRVKINYSNGFFGFGVIRTQELFK